MTHADKNKEREVFEVEYWQQGRLIQTQQTRRWSKEEQGAADKEEKHMIFSNFREEDAGRSRQFIAQCRTPQEASYIIEQHNFLIDALVQARAKQVERKPTPQPDKQIIDHVAMRLAQITSGDYKVCGLTAQEVAADAFLVLRGMRYATSTQPDPQFSNYQTDGGQ